jgi:hypothetical protein
MVTEHVAAVKADSGNVTFNSDSIQTQNCLSTGALCYVDADIESFEDTDCVVAGYYEVTLDSAGYYDQIAIGLTSDVDSYPLTEFVGYHEKSIAFHCDTGSYF